MKSKRKKILAICLLIFGIIVIGLGVYSLFFQRNADSEIDSDNNTNNYINASDLDFKIINFKVDINAPNLVKLRFDILNNDNPLPEKKLKLNFYENDKIVYIFEYQINKMNSFEEITIETNLDFEYTKLTKYEFEIDNKKFEMTPYFD